MFKHGISRQKEASEISEDMISREEKAMGTRLTNNIITQGRFTREQEW